MNNLVKEYKGVNIYVSPRGEFYCDAIGNSNDYKNKTFTSTKIISIEKGIDNFTGQEIENGNVYYDILTHNTTIKSLKVVKRVGYRVFFDDGTDTSQQSRRYLYPEVIKDSKEFKDLEIIFAEIKKHEAEISSLYTLTRTLRDSAVKKLYMFSRVEVTK